MGFSCLNLFFKFRILFFSCDFFLHRNEAWGSSPRRASGSVLSTRNSLAASAFVLVCTEINVAALPAASPSLFHGHERRSPIMQGNGYFILLTHFLRIYPCEEMLQHFITLSDSLSIHLDSFQATFIFNSIVCPRVPLPFCKDEHEPCYPQVWGFFRVRHPLSLVTSGSFINTQTNLRKPVSHQKGDSCLLSSNQ